MSTAGPAKGEDLDTTTTTTCVVFITNEKQCSVGKIPFSLDA
jgi:hypothetical protein